MLLATAQFFCAQSVVSPLLDQRVLVGLNDLPSVLYGATNLSVIIELFFFPVFKTIELSVKDLRSGIKQLPLASPVQ
jgi:hypothetical protein